MGPTLQLSTNGESPALPSPQSETASRESMGLESQTMESMREEIASLKEQLQMQLQSTEKPLIEMGGEVVDAVFSFEDVEESMTRLNGDAGSKDLKPPSAGSSMRDAEGQ